MNPLILTWRNKKGNNRHLEVIISLGKAVGPLLAPLFFADKEDKQVYLGKPHPEPPAWIFILSF